MQHQRYIKLSKSTKKSLSPAIFHIHVDSIEILPGALCDKLQELGFTFDLFDLGRSIFGYCGDIKRTFPHHAPYLCDSK